MPSASLDDLKRPIAAELTRLNRFIDQSLVTPNEMMTGIIRSFLTSKGKQIRPILVILSARIFGTPNDDTIRAAAAVEMLHNASLIHDDVIDRSDTRHGRPTINSVWDNHISVLVGDFFVSKALEAATLTSDLRIIRVLSRLGQLLSTGEMDQICNARDHSTSEADYFTVISRKTASLFEACVDMGAYSVGIGDDDPRLPRLRRFAHLLGLCFQIRDDIFDYGSSALPGKPTGNDLLEGKVTLPLLHALNSDHPEAPAMRALLAGDSLDHDKVGRLVDFAVRAGGIDYARARMQALRDEAASLVDDPVPLTLFDYIIARQA